MNPQLTEFGIFSGNNLDKVYKEAMTKILKDGSDLTFGDKDEVKEAREIFGIMHLYGNALKDVLKGKTPKGFKYTGSQVRALMDTFVANAINPTGFEYTYPEILRNQPAQGMINREKHTNMDQIVLSQNLLRTDIMDRIKSNRNVGWIGNPGFTYSRDKPCFNWYQLRYMGHRKTVLGKEIPMVSFRMLFRSHDWGDAVMGNASSIGHGFNELVIKPLGGEMLEMIIISSSAHIYEKESQMCEEVFGIPYKRSKEGRGIS